MASTLCIGLSTCPNDTFAFHALMAREVDWRGLELGFDLADVEELNERMLAGELDASKLSFAAALELGSRIAILECGSALGFGVGPLVLAAPNPQPGCATRVLAPGRWTTAALLWKLFHPERGEPEHVVFSAIMPALQRGEAGTGLCIHEGRFTWREHGLERLEDLGRTWEEATGLPLPLGGIAARRELGVEVLGKLAACVRDSIEWGLAHRVACLPTMRKYAQELSDEVLWRHVELYVNQDSLELGGLGRAALARLSKLARESGFAAKTGKIEIVRGAGAGNARVFHLIRAVDWAEYSRGGQQEWRPQSLEREGFVHLSFPGQIAGTLAAHFRGEEVVVLVEVVLVEVERGGLGGELKMERSRGGEVFPHVYRGIERREFGRSWKVKRLDGVWKVPVIARETAGDWPQGEALGRA